MSELSIFAIVTIAIIIIIIIAIIGTSLSDRGSQEYERPRRVRVAKENILQQILFGKSCDEDILLTNVDIFYDGRKAELDNVIINKYGVFHH